MSPLLCTVFGNVAAVILLTSVSYIFKNASSQSLEEQKNQCCI